MRYCFILAILVLGNLLAGAQTAPAGDAPTKQVVPPTAESPGWIITRDAENRVVRKDPNPEAQVPWDSTLKGSAADKVPEKKPNVAVQIINTIVNLALVLALMYVALLLLKKYYQGGMRNPLAGVFGAKTPTRRAIRVLETVGLGPGRSLSIVSVGERCFLIAATGQAVTVLSEVTGDAEIEGMLTQIHEPTTGNSPQTFLATLADLLPGTVGQALRTKSNAPVQGNDTTTHRNTL